MAEDKDTRDRAQKRQAEQAEASRSRTSTRSGKPAGHDDEPLTTAEVEARQKGGISPESEETYKPETIKVTLRDTSDSAVASVRRHVALNDGEIVGDTKDTLTVQPALESNRRPGARRQRLVESLANDPLVESVE